MKKFRNILILILLLVIISCSSQEVRKPLPSLAPPKATEKTTSQIPIKLSDGGAATVQNEIKNNWKNNISREILVGPGVDMYEVLVGEYMRIPKRFISDMQMDESTELKFVFNEEKDFYTFRSLYQGIYPANVTFDDGTTKEIKIYNKMKYKFTKQDCYEAAKNFYEKGLYQEALQIIDLYSIAFPTDTYEKYFGLLRLKVYLATNNYLDAKVEIMELKKMKFSPEEQKYLQEYEEKILAQKQITAELEKVALPPALIPYADEVISADITPEERAKLEAASNKFEQAKDFYSRRRYSQATVLLESMNSQDKNYDMSRFHLGQAYFQMKLYDRASFAYETYLSKRTTDITQAEARFNLAISYINLGKESDAMTLFQLNMQLFPGTAWERKSNVEIVKLKNK
ncbi:MAG: tetratricopeptide repeat protein [Fusobacteriaceae bacterium]